MYRSWGISISLVKQCQKYSISHSILISRWYSGINAVLLVINDQGALINLPHLERFGFEGRHTVMFEVSLSGYGIITTIYYKILRYTNIQNKRPWIQIYHGGKNVIYNEFLGRHWMIPFQVFAKKLNVLLKDSLLNSRKWPEESKKRRIFTTSCHAILFPWGQI